MGGKISNNKQIGWGLTAMMPGATIILSIARSGIDNRPLIAVLLYIASLFIVIGLYYILCGFLDIDDRRDKKIIYNWLYNKTKIYEGRMILYPSPIWVSTIDIANAVCLKPERVREICFGHIEIDIQAKKHIPKDKEPEEKWGIKIFVDVFD